MASILKVENISHTNGTAAMTIDDSGRVLQPAKPAILCMGNNGNNVSVGNFTILPPANFETSTNGFAQGGMSYNNTNGEITVPVDGVYSIYGQLYNNASSNDARIIIRVNGTDKALGHIGSGQIATAATQIVLNLSADDKITFINRNATSVFMGASHTFLQAYLIG